MTDQEFENYQNFPDTEAALKFLRTIHTQESQFAIEMRGLRKTRDGRQLISSGIYGSRQYAKMVADAAEINQKMHADVYYSLNRVRAEGRRLGEFSHTTSTTISDNEIHSYSNLLVDLDPVRLKGIPSHDEQIAAALQVAEEVRTYMSSCGFSEPIILFSGNGYHLLWRVAGLAQPMADKPVTEQPHLVIPSQRKWLLYHLAEKFDAAKTGIGVDTSVHNASRIARLPGYRNQKAQRWSKVHQYPADYLPNNFPVLIRKMGWSPDIKTMPKIARKLGVSPDGQLALSLGGIVAGDNDNFLLDEEGVQAIIDQYGLDLIGVRDHDGSLYYDLGTCPYADRTHEGQNAHSCSLVFTPGENIGFSCMAEHCHDVTFLELLDKLEEENDPCETPVFGHRLRDAQLVDYIKEHFTWVFTHTVILDTTSSPVPEPKPESLTAAPDPTPVTEPVEVSNPAPTPIPVPEPTLPPEIEARIAAIQCTPALVIPTGVPLEAMRRMALTKLERQLATARDLPAAARHYAEVKNTQDPLIIAKVLGQIGLDALHEESDAVPLAAIKQYRR
jgi:hypothetical protein